MTGRRIQFDAYNGDHDSIQMEAIRKASFLYPTKIPLFFS
jgi:hypothetical protein